MTFEQLKGTYRHRKTAKKVEVVSMRRDSVGLRHESGRETYKAVHYFIEEYVRVSDTSINPVTCSDCKVERGYRPMLDYVGLCSRHASLDSLIAALTDIASFTDKHASDHLTATGNYSLFDEPGSVEVARTALGNLAKGKANGTNT